MQLSDNARGALYMNVAMAAFTINDAFMKAAMQTIPLFQAISLRGAMATLALIVIASRMGGLTLRIPRRDMGYLALRCLAEVAGTALFLTALTRMEFANLSAILQALPLAVTLAAAVFLKEPIGWRRLTAILVGFIGVLIIIRPGPDGFDTWALLALAAVLCIVLRDLATKQMSRALPSVTVAVCAAAAVLVMGLFGMWVQGAVPMRAGEILMILGATSALIFGYLTSVMTMRIGEIAFVAPFRYMALLWTLVLGWAVFDELPDGLTLFGAALVVATGIFTFWRERRVRLPGAKGP